MLLGYCRNMAREDRGFKPLKETLDDNTHTDAAAHTVWHTATYVDSHPWADADLTDCSLADRGSYTLVLAMTSLTDAQLLAPQFWAWIAGVLRPGGMFAAWVDAFHVLDSYVCLRGHRATVHRCARVQSLAQMSAHDQVDYVQALSDLATDIGKWTGGVLMNADSEEVMLPDASRLSLCLGRC